MARAPLDAVKNLVDVLQLYEDDLLKWLAGPAANDRHPTETYVAFSDLLQAADYARLRLKMT